MLRWLLPVIAAIALVGSTLTAWASAGIVGEAACCCPVKAKCKCHDHDQQPDLDTKLQKCGGEVKLVTPMIASAVPSVAMRSVVELRAERVTTELYERSPDVPVFEVETPPF